MMPVEFKGQRPLVWEYIHKQICAAPRTAGHTIHKV